MEHSEIIARDHRRSHLEHFVLVQQSAQHYGPLVSEKCMLILSRAHTVLDIERCPRPVERDLSEPNITSTAGWHPVPPSRLAGSQDCREGKQYAVADPKAGLGEQRGREDFSQLHRCPREREGMLGPSRPALSRSRSREGLGWVAAR